MVPLSRKCICDTLLAKRQCHGQLTGFVRQLYNLNICMLRKNQLSHHVETKMISNRYLDKYLLKRAAAEIIIVVRGGMVQQVRSSNPYTSIYIVDYDTYNIEPDYEAKLSDIGERAVQPDMHVVY